MIICGQEFDFSALNANDIERMEAAQAHMEQANAAEQARPKTGMADALRGQCRLVMGFLDDLLGEGASDRLGLDGSDFRACKQALDSFRQAIDAEKAELSPQPANREQRRTQQRTQTAGRIVTVDQFCRGKPIVTIQEDPAEKAQHLADAQIAMSTLRNDPKAMQQLAELALKLAADHHV